MSFFSERYQPAFFLVLILALITLTVLRNSLWQDDVRLMLDIADRNPGKSRPFVNLGRAYEQQGRNDEALAAFLAAAKIDPANPHARFNIGNIYEVQGRRAEAAAEFEESIRLGGQYPAAYYALGSYYEDCGRLDDAAAAYRYILMQRPFSHYAMTRLAATLLKQRRMPEAIRQLETIVRYFPDDRDAAELLQRAGK